MDPLYMANSLFRRRRYEDCVQVCTEILETNPYDQVSPPATPPIYNYGGVSAVAGGVVPEAALSHRADVRGRGGDGGGGHCRGFPR